MLDSLKFNLIKLNSIVQRQKIYKHLFYIWTIKLPNVNLGFSNF